MLEENTGQEFRLKNIYETKKYILEKIKHNELISEKHKKTCKNDEYLHILASTIAVCVSISSFTSVVGILVEITSSAVWLKFV